jgi:hypothetical protein
MQFNSYFKEDQLMQKRIPETSRRHCSINSPLFGSRYNIVLQNNKKNIDHHRTLQDLETTKYHAVQDISGPCSLLVVLH